ncbi:hypothetical protein NHQ30_000623 [Ciborinia camelliae]|nr:hypothetical protein NHQ30_000623 [Ciborinia camelliae]
MKQRERDDNVTDRLHHLTLLRGPEIFPSIGNLSRVILSPKNSAQCWAALESGYDPNEMDNTSQSERSTGRTLHYATGYITFDYSRRCENLLVVELLLNYGADPRMPGMGGVTGSPLRELRLVVNFNSPERKSVSERDMESFEKALQARELDGEFLCLGESECN